jgi:AcrR family transcriptional regulator
VPQFKKPAVREAILRSAKQLFSRRGYSGTNLIQIARGANISAANMYNYFKSKLEILYAIYDPWIRMRLNEIEQRMSETKGSRAKVRILLRSLWRDMPIEGNGFVNNIMQALSSAKPEDRYRPTTLRWMEGRLEQMLLTALPVGKRRKVSRARLSLFLVIAYDGFTIYRHVFPDRPVSEQTIEAAVSMILA